MTRCCRASNALLLRFQTVSNLLPSRPEEAKARIDSVVEEGSNAITEGRDAVHELRSMGLMTIDFAQSIRNFAKELFGTLPGSQIPEFLVQVEGNPKDLNPVVRDEAYRIAAEALRNAIRHAGAKRIEVELRYNLEDLTLRIRDDGKGIDAGVLDKEHAPGHWGLRGMRERAKLIGASFEIWSKPGSGTEMELKIPRPRKPRIPNFQPRADQSPHEPHGANRVNSDSNPIRIQAVDDHPIFRHGNSGLLADQSDLKLVAEGSNGLEAIQQYRLQRPDIVLIDLQMPEMNGVDAIIAIRGEFPDARIIVLTTYAGDAQVLRALKAGAQAFLLKNLLHKDLLDTIRAVHSGRKALSPEASFEIAEHATDDPLSKGEVDVLRLSCSFGNANKQIADRLSITEETVKGRVKNILSKLNANDRTHAATIGLKRGIIEL